MSLRDIKAVRLGGRVLDLVFADNPPDAGLIEDDIGRITIETSSPGAESEILLHECLHGLITLARLDLREEHEEEIVNRLTPWLHALIVQNAAMITEIIENG